MEERREPVRGIALRGDLLRRRMRKPATSQARGIAGPTTPPEHPHDLATNGIKTSLGPMAPELATFEARTATWLARNIELFDPAATEADARDLVHEAAVELALLLAYRRLLRPSAPLESAYLQIRDFLWTTFPADALTVSLATDHSRFLSNLLMHAALNVSGRPSEPTDHVVRKMLSHSNVSRTERTPFRRLEFMHAQSLLFGRDAYTTLQWENTFSEALLGLSPNVMRAEDEDAYGLTRAVFYLADFGLAPPERAGLLASPATRHRVAAMARRYRLRGDADLVAEFLMSLLCCGVLVSEEYAHGWTFLLEREAGTGRLEAVRHKLLQVTPLSLSCDYARLEWRRCHHTTLVATLAAMMFRRAHESHDFPSLRGCHTRSSEAITEELRAGERACRRALEQCDRIEPIESAARPMHATSPEPIHIDVSAELFTAATSDPRSVLLGLLELRRQGLAQLAVEPHQQAVLLDVMFTQMESAVGDGDLVALAALLELAVRLELRELPLTDVAEVLLSQQRAVPH